MKLYHQADICLFLSRYRSGFSRIPLEAMACGLPVVAARTGGVLDTVVDGVNGFYYDPARPEAIRLLVSRLRNDP